MAQDAWIALQIACVCDKQRRFKWTTQRGKISSMELPRGWLTVGEAMHLPLPDTSWMDHAIPRQTFTRWVTEKRNREKNRRKADSAEDADETLPPFQGY